MSKSINNAQSKAELDQQEKERFELKYSARRKLMSEEARAEEDEKNEKMRLMSKSEREKKNTVGNKPSKIEENIKGMLGSAYKPEEKTKTIVTKDPKYSKSSSDEEKTPSRSAPSDEEKESINRNSGKEEIEEVEVEAEDNDEDAMYVGGIKTTTSSLSKEEMEEVEDAELRKWWESAEFNKEHRGKKIKVNVDEEGVKLAKEGILVIEDRKVKNFRNQNKKFFLTYSTHLPKTMIKRTFEERFPETKMENFYIVHESGDTTNPYMHTHVAINFTPALNRRGADIFDIECPRDINEKGYIHCYIAKIRIKKHWENILHYMSKEDPDMAEFKEKEEQCFMEKIWSNENVQEALKKNAHKPSDISGIILAFDHKPYRPPPLDEDDMPTKEWQWDLIKELETTKASKRKYIWYYEHHGKSGKSTVCRYLCKFKPDEFKYYMVAGSADYRNLAAVVKGARDDGWKGHCILIDIQMDLDFRDLYTGLESIKNKYMTTTKYMGRGFWIEKLPHIVIFSNKIPHTWFACAPDRWDIRQLDRVGTTASADKYLSEEEYKKIEYSTTKLCAYKIKHEYSMLNEICNTNAGGQSITEILKSAATKPKSSGIPMIDVVNGTIVNHERIAVALCMESPKWRGSIFNR